MIRSMTGFARRELAGPSATLAWELRSVNHRYLEISLRLPDDLRAAETEARQAIAAVVRRGKVDATLFFRPAAAVAQELEINQPLLDRLIECSLAVRQRIGGGATLNAGDLLRWPGVVREAERDTGSLATAAMSLLRDALQALTESRASEGARIAELIRTRAAAIETAANHLSSRLPEVRSRIRTKLLERLQQVAVEPNHDRLEQEIVFLLQRMDIDEELDRLRSHVLETRKVIAADEPAGRRLDFLMQEFNREANTLSSKSQDTDTTRTAVDIKVLVEQMREQVQNIE
jgi:uncharacterized protein (TIGR00255 family)